MLARITNFLAFAIGKREIVIAKATSDYVELVHGSVRTVFDRRSQRVLQNGREVASLALVERIELHFPMNQSGTPNWFVTVHIRGGRQIEVGQSTDSTDASIVAARIAGVAQRQVVVHPRTAA
jgi:hypothetical protein